MIILSHKKPGFHLFPEKHVLGKTTGSQIDHSPVFSVKRWSKFHFEKYNHDKKYDNLSFVSKLVYLKN